MTFTEYSLKFIKLSRYATSLVLNIKDEMIKFLKEISKELEEEFQHVMLHDSMDLSMLMVHVHQE